MIHCIFLKYVSVILIQLFSLIMYFSLIQSDSLSMNFPLIHLASFKYVIYLDSLSLFKYVLDILIHCTFHKYLLPTD